MKKGNAKYHGNRKMIREYIQIVHVEWQNLLQLGKINIQ